MFLEGIAKLTEREKLALAALLNTLTGWTLLGDAAKGGMQKAKEAALSWLSSIATQHYQSQLDKLEGKLDWDPDSLQQKLAAEMEAFSGLDVAQIEEELSLRLKEIAGIDDENREILANAMVHRAATSLGLDVRRYLSAASLEEAAFVTTLSEFLKALKEELLALDFSGKRRFEEILSGELCKLKQEELAILTQALPARYLSAAVLISWLESEENSEELASHYGPGALLLFAVILRATSLFKGVGFPLDTGEEHNPTLAFLLSGSFLYLVLTGSDSPLKVAAGNVGDRLAKLLLLVGRGKL